MVNLKATIDYNTILFKAQLNYIATVSLTVRDLFAQKVLKGTILYLRLSIGIAS